MRYYNFLAYLLAVTLLVPACGQNDPPSDQGNHSQPSSSTATDTDQDVVETNTDQDSTDTDVDTDTDTNDEDEYEEEILPPAIPNYQETLCGNGMVDPGEQCDDNNRDGHDGCNKYCQIEKGYTCQNGDEEASTCIKICGNGRIDEGEACDDGNTEDHDGCSSKCQFEDTFDCETDSEPTKCYTNEFYGLGSCLNPYFFVGNNWVITGDDFEKEYTDSFNIGCSQISSEAKDVVVEVALKAGELLQINEDVEYPGFFIVEGACEVLKTCPTITTNRSNWAYYYTNKDEIVSAIFTRVYPTINQPYKLHIEKGRPRCGDGHFILMAEECDDGNTDDGDGCSSSCTIEPGYTCKNTAWRGSKEEPSVCTTQCGNGVLDENEQCDDSNNNSGDGCSSSCQLEKGFHCPRVGPCTNDGSWEGNALNCQTPGIMLGDEIHIEGSNFANDFPDKSLKPSCGYYWNNSYRHAIFQVDLKAGEILTTSNFGSTNTVYLFKDSCNLAICDYGFIAIDDQHVYTASKPETVWVMFYDFYNQSNYTKEYNIWLKKIHTECGNGKLEAESGESCDDGNAIAGDGCDANCHVEQYWECATNVTPSLCTVKGSADLSDLPPPVDGVTDVGCGNGDFDGSEACDDGNTENGDGCSSTCQVEAGYHCLRDNNVHPALRCYIVAGVCGNGYLEDGETCDDGNNLNGDGCSAECNLEAGYICYGSFKSTCYYNVITEGDGKTVDNPIIIDRSVYLSYDDFGATFTNNITRTGAGCLDKEYSAKAPEAIFKVKLQKGQILKITRNSNNKLTTSVSILQKNSDGSANTSECRKVPDLNNIIKYIADKDQEIYVVWEATAANELAWHDMAAIHFYISTPECGDGILEGLEECDPHKSNMGGACNDDCTVKEGYVCDFDYCYANNKTRKPGNMNSCFTAPIVDHIKYSGRLKTFVVANQYPTSQRSSETNSALRLLAFDIKAGQRVIITSAADGHSWNTKLYRFNDCNEIPVQVHSGGNSFDYTSAVDERLYYSYRENNTGFQPAVTEVTFTFNPANE